MLTPFIILLTAAIIVAIGDKVYKTIRKKQEPKPEPRYRIIKTTTGEKVSYRPEIYLTSLDNWAERYGRPVTFTHWATISNYVDFETREDAELVIQNDKLLYENDRRTKTKIEEIVYEE